MLTLMKLVLSLIPYAVLAYVGFILGEAFSPTSPKCIGAVIAALGVLFTLVDAFLWKVLDGARDCIASSALHSRQVVELNKRLTRRASFLKIRWTLAGVAYLTMIVVGVLVYADATLLIKHSWIPSAVMALLLCTFPAIVSLMLARWDLVAFQTDILCQERAATDVERELGAIRSTTDNSGRASTQ